MSKKRTLGYQSLACKECGDMVHKVDQAADAITCSRCVQRQLAGPCWVSEEEYFENYVDREIGELHEKEE
jgi:hypothetical protein